VWQGGAKPDFSFAGVSNVFNWCHQYYKQCLNGILHYVFSKIIDIKWQGNGIFIAVWRVRASLAPLLPRGAQTGGPTRPGTGPTDNRLAGPRPGNRAGPARLTGLVLPLIEENSKKLCLSEDLNPRPPSTRLKTVTEGH
jgi:hypothetical protein